MITEEWLEAEIERIGLTFDDVGPCESVCAQVLGDHARLHDDNASAILSLSTWERILPTLEANGGHEEFWGTEEINEAPDTWREIWDELETPVFLVLDEEGVNMADAQVRQLPTGSWLYVDDVDGWDVLTDVSRLILEKKKGA